LPHFGRPEQAVAEFRRVLTDEGRLALTAWDFPARARLVGVLLDAVQEVGIASPGVVPAGPNFFRFADDMELESLLTDQGFVHVGIRTVEFMHGVGSAEELWDGLLHGTVRTSAVIRGQSAEVVRRIRASFDAGWTVIRPARSTSFRFPSSSQPPDDADAAAADGAPGNQSSYGGRKRLTRGRWSTPQTWQRPGNR
jgi:hypothetical protein